eukprot:9121572-Alexandrium_andersonii.AAC.1
MAKSVGPFQLTPRGANFAPLRKDPPGGPAAFKRGVAGPGNAGRLLSVFSSGEAALSQRGLGELRVECLVLPGSRIQGCRPRLHSKHGHRLTSVQQARRRRGQAHLRRVGRGLRRAHHRTKQSCAG